MSIPPVYVSYLVDFEEDELGGGEKALLDVWLEAGDLL